MVLHPHCCDVARSRAVWENAAFLFLRRGAMLRGTSLVHRGIFPDSQIPLTTRPNALYKLSASETFRMFIAGRFGMCEGSADFKDPGPFLSIAVSTPT